MLKGIRLGCKVREVVRGGIVGLGSVPGFEAELLVDLRQVISPTSLLSALSTQVVSSVV